MSRRIVMQLRPYQTQAIDHVFSKWKTSSSVLLHLATGTGKTIIFSELCRQLASQGKRVCILMHLHTLVQQTRDKISLFWDKPIGLICSTYSKIKDSSCLITIASIQSLSPYLKNNPDCSFDYCIIDEGHHIPPKDIYSQYGQTLSELYERNPNFKILGVTATPFRLKQGSIVGGENSWFSEISFSYNVIQAQKDGFLCLYHHIVPVDLRDDLSQIPLSGGEYQKVPLSELLRQPKNLSSISKSIINYAKDRRHIVVYAVDIKHALAIEKKLHESGIPTGCVHSKSVLNESTFKQFTSGVLRVLVSVDMLTEGYDFPAIDCIVVARPTKSLARHLQIIGRGLRIAEGKKDCLIIDLVGNAYFHGSARHPILHEEGPKSEIIVACPHCFTLNGVVPGNTKTYVCTNCGFDLREAAGITAPKKNKLSNGKIRIRQEKERPLLPYLEEDEIRRAVKKGQSFSCISAFYQKKQFFKSNYIAVTMYFEHEGHTFSASLNLSPEGLYRDYFLTIWDFWGDKAVPNTVDECITAIQEARFAIPSTVKLKYTKKGNLRPHFPWGTFSFTECGFASGTLTCQPETRHTNAFLRH